MAATNQAATTVLHSTPPPTANKLASDQKFRLMRSTRKLGQVLGTTPHLLETSLPITLLPVGSKKSVKGSRSDRSMLAHSPSSSTSSFQSDLSISSRAPSPPPLPLFDAKSDALLMPHPNFSDPKPHRSTNAPRPLYIRLNVVPVSPSDNRFTTSLPPTPTTANPLTPSTNHSFPPTPCTPTFDQSEVRRKRMAKLTRHLGESIPPQLISSAARKRRSMSVGGLAKPLELGFSQLKPAVSYCPSPSTVDRQVSWVGEWNRDDMKDIQKQLRALKGR
jgi:hypothetical protein